MDTSLKEMSIFFMLTIGIGGGDETGLREYDKNKSLCAEDTGGKKNWILD